MNLPPERQETVADAEDTAVPEKAVADAEETAVPENAGPAPNDFTTEAIKALVSANQEFLDDLTLLSRLLAKRAKADVTSAAHVETALHLLGIGVDRRAQWTGALGGVLLGTGGSGLISVLLEEPVSPELVVTMAVLIVFGSAGLTYSFARTK